MATQSKQKKANQVMRYSMWYWLNSAPDEYANDFRQMRDIGCDSVCLAFGLDLSLIARQPEMVRQALDLCTELGLHAKLIIYNPTSIGTIAESHQPTQIDGAKVARANIFSDQWNEQWWLPYLRKLVEQFADHPAMQGYLLDDTFSCSDGTFYSYSEVDRKRFIEYLREQYVELPRLNDLWRSSKPIGDWNEIQLPRNPITQTGAWADWTDARRSWTKNWAKRTVETLHAGPAHHAVVYTDYDYYWRRSAMTHGADLADTAHLFDEYGLYEAMPKASMSHAAIMHNWQSELQTARAFAPEKPQHALLWLTDVRTFEPMEEATLLGMLQVAQEHGVAESQLYAFRVSDWNAKATFQPPYTHLGKSHPLSVALYQERIEMLKRVIAKVKSQPVPGDSKE